MYVVTVFKLQMSIKIHFIVLFIKVSYRIINLKCNKKIMMTNNNAIRFYYSCA